MGLWSEFQWLQLYQMSGLGLQNCSVYLDCFFFCKTTAVLPLRNCLRTQFFSEYKQKYLITGKEADLLEYVQLIGSLGLFLC